MTAEKLFAAIDLIGDDLISGAVMNDKSNHKKSRIYVAAVAIIVLAFSLAAAVAFDNKPVIEPFETSGEYFGGVAESEPVNYSEVVFEGTPFTDDEIKKFVDENKYLIAGAIACEYERFNEEYRILTKGYSHVSLGNKNILNLNAIDLPVMLDGRIIGEVTLVKEDGRYIHTISVRGEGINRLNNMFENNKDKEFVFLYVNNFTQTAVSQSNEVFIINGPEKVNLDASVNIYEKFRTEYNTYSYDVLMNPDNSVSVYPPTEEKAQGSNIPQESDEIISPIVTQAHIDTVDITLKDILSKEIVAIECGNSYDLLSGKDYRKCNDTQSAQIMKHLLAMDGELVTNHEMKFGGLWHIKLIYSDNTSVLVVIADEEYFIETDEGTSPYYYDTTGNSISLIYYIAEM